MMMIRQKMKSLHLTACHKYSTLFMQASHSVGLIVASWFSLEQNCSQVEDFNSTTILFQRKSTCYSTLHLTQDHQLPSTPLPLMNTWKMKQMKKRISKSSPWTMNIGLLKRFLTDHCAYTNLHYHTDYADTHVNMWITRLRSISRPWI